jgi:hypothetical protein
MNTIQDMFQQAQLAKAAYTNLWDSTLNQPIIDDAKVITALIAAGMSDAQAADFVTHWRVVSQQPNTASGFSATVFEKLDANGQGTGQFTFAMRGSENPFVSSETKMGSD